mmetsp:Transcript_14095/g.43034  ORF Transcript_14095/g.43034 Transcript_14095/m.43034 type:complete len:264 (-) Transcript_14095:114-905(-)
MMPAAASLRAEAEGASAWLWELECADRQRSRSSTVGAAAAEALLLGAVACSPRLFQSYRAQSSAPHCLRRRLARCGHTRPPQTGLHCPGPSGRACHSMPGLGHVTEATILAPASQAGARGRWALRCGNWRVAVWWHPARCARGGMPACSRQDAAGRPQHPLRRPVPRLCPRGWWPLPRCGGSRWRARRPSKSALARSPPPGRPGERTPRTTRRSPEGWNSPPAALPRQSPSARVRAREREREREREKRDETRRDKRETPRAQQ